MAQDLFSEIRFLSVGDFSQEDVIVDNVITGKKLPTSISIFTSDKKQRIFLELWNETDIPIKTFVRVGNSIYMNNEIDVCSESRYAHTFHQIDINIGEELLAS